MRISVIQTDIVWEDKQYNLRRLRQKLQALKGETEIVFLPETFSTGFTAHVTQLAESPAGATVSLLRQWAAEFQLAIAGSFLAYDEREDNTRAYYNRAFFLTPEGDAWFSDKRHLFGMGGEAGQFTPGEERTIISYRGYHILLLVCYDLRFPVWSRNTDNEYDLLAYVANWPASRRKVWDVLLQARALENMCYTCGVNRIGTDGNMLKYNGGSCIYSPKGELIGSVADNEEGTATATLDLQKLNEFRNKFPVWKDADSFVILSDNSSR